MEFAGPASSIISGMYCNFAGGKFKLQEQGSLRMESEQLFFLLTVNAILTSPCMLMSKDYRVYYEGVSTQSLFTQSINL